VGRYPAAEVAARPAFGEVVPSVPAGLPSELLERRPDVIAAQKRVGAAFSRVKEAQAARLPRISLTGSVSDLTSELFVLQDRDNPVWSIGGALFMPLFAGGELKAQVEIRTAEQKQAVAEYVKTALAAFGDVENALSSELALEERETILTAAVNDAERALRLSEIRYRVGKGDLRSVEEHWMLIFIPIALVLEHMPGIGAPMKFLAAALAIVPIASLIGTSTEHLTHYTGESIGGLLNATFGNLPELIICLVALQAGLHEMVTASLVGAILFNLLLIMGLARWSRRTVRAPGTRARS
jgi:hypothetical protein